MRLSDIMGAAGLAFYAEVALTLFVVAFVIILLTIMARRNQSLWEHARFLPLEDGDVRGVREPGQENR